MSLKFKGNKTVTQILDKSKNIKKEKLIYESQQFIDEPNQIVKMASKTDAQIKFDLIRKKRIKGRVEERLKLTHKDRVEKFNNDLNKLSEHYDIPKIGPG